MSLILSLKNYLKPVKNLLNKVLFVLKFNTVKTVNRSNETLPICSNFFSCDQ